MPKARFRPFFFHDKDAGPAPRGDRSHFAALFYRHQWWWSQVEPHHALLLTLPRPLHGCGSTSRLRISLIPPISAKSTRSDKISAETSMALCNKLMQGQRRCHPVDGFQIQPATANGSKHKAVITQLPELESGFDHVIYFSFGINKVPFPASQHNFYRYRTFVVLLFWPVLYQV